MTTRGKRDAARAVIDSGIDPNARKRAGDAESAKTADTFEVIAREWYDSKTPTWAPMHAKRVMERLEADIFKFLGSMPIEKVEAPQLLTALRRVEDRGAVETAHRLRRTCGQIYRYAIATGRAKRNPASDLDGALRSYKNGHFAAVDRR